MTAIVIGVVGTVVASALARAARRARVVGRLRRLRPRARLPLPAPVRARLGAALARADVDLTPDDAVRTWLLAAVVAALLGGALGVPIGIAAVLAMLAGGPVALWWARGREDERVVGALPGALDRVAAGLRAGGTVPDGIAGLAAAAGPLAPDLFRVDARCRLGAALTDALTQWSRERPRPEIGAVSGALALAVKAGGASAAALEGLGESLRTRDATRREARALTAQTRLSAWVVGAAPVAYLGFASIADPTTFDTLLTTNAGRACLVVGLTLEALAALWMRTLLRDEP